MRFSLLCRAQFAAVVAAVLLPGWASAQSYPNQPIRIIVPNPAG